MNFNICKNHDPQRAGSLFDVTYQIWKLLEQWFLEMKIFENYIKWPPFWPTNRRNWATLVGYHTYIRIIPVMLHHIHPSQLEGNHHVLGTLYNVNVLNLCVGLILNQDHEIKPNWKRTSRSCYITNTKLLTHLCN